jgi:hypothetical protein
VLDNKTVRKHKAALTRAKKISPEKVIAVCDAALDDFKDNGYPDCWHLWEMAKYDATTQLLLKG